MNSLLEVLAFVLGACFVLALFFVFDGEPDVWDAWQKHAMESAK